MFDRETLHCFDRRCDAKFEGPKRRTIHARNEACMEAAGQAGWVIGHIDGQAHYACPDHANQLWEPIVLHAIDRRFRKRAQQEAKERV